MTLGLDLHPLDRFNLYGEGESEDNRCAFQL